MDAASIMAAAGLGVTSVSPIELQICTSRLTDAGLTSLSILRGTLEDLEIAGESVNDERIRPIEQFSKFAS